MLAVPPRITLRGMANNNYSMGSIDLGLGGVDNTLTQQMKDEEEERRRKLLQAGNGGQNATAKALGLGTINILGGGGA